MQFTRKLRDKGTISVPVEIIESYEIRTGDKVVFEVLKVIKHKL